MSQNWLGCCRVVSSWQQPSSLVCLYVIMMQLCLSCNSFKLKYWAHQAAWTSRWTAACLSHFLQQGSRAKGIPERAMHAKTCQGRTLHGSGLDKSTEWWNALAGMLLEARLLTYQSKQGQMGNYTIISTTPQVSKSTPHVRQVIGQMTAMTDMIETQALSLQKGSLVPETPQSLGLKGRLQLRSVGARDRG